MAATPRFRSTRQAVAPGLSQLKSRRMDHAGKPEHSCHDACPRHPSSPTIPASRVSAMSLRGAWPASLLLTVVRSGRRFARRRVRSQPAPGRCVGLRRGSRHQRGRPSRRAPVSVRDAHQRQSAVDLGLARDRQVSAGKNGASPYDRAAPPSPARKPGQGKLGCADCQTSRLARQLAPCRVSGAHRRARRRRRSRHPRRRAGVRPGFTVRRRACPPRAASFGAEIRLGAGKGSRRDFRSRRSRARSQSRPGETRKPSA